MSEVTYRVATSFSRYPGGRLKKRGPYSGEEFRISVLEPLLDKYDRITIDLDGVIGFPPSFLDESFGEMGKQLGYSEVKDRVFLLCSDDPFLVDLIWRKVRKGAEEGGLS